jgi:beta-mannosidase
VNQILTGPALSSLLPLLTSPSHRDLYVGDYLKLYVDTIYVAIGDVEGHNQRPFVDSSPSNGIISADPYVKQWGSASTPHAGDTHFYDYSSDCEAYAMYPASKFVSEFGFQVHPSFLAYEPVTIKEDRKTDSAFSAYRQRHQDGNYQMEAQMTRHFTLPVDDGSCGDEGERGGAWDSYLYLSQIQQSRCYETAINYWRSLRSDVTAQTMGILYWQLNDIWEGPSWASMEWGGRWKPLQYTVKRVFAEVSTSLLGLPGADEVKIHGVNDLLDDAQVTYSLYLIPWSAQTNSLTDDTLVSTSKLNLPASSSQVIETLSVDAILSSHPSSNCSRSTCFLFLQATSLNLRTSQLSTLPAVPFYLETFKEIGLTVKPQIVTRDFQQLSPTSIEFLLEVDQVSPFLFMELTGPNQLLTAEGRSSDGVNNVNAGWFSDNNFLALPGEQYSLTYTSLLPIGDLNDWKNKLQIRSLQSVRIESCSK